MQKRLLADIGALYTDIQELSKYLGLNINIDWWDLKRKIKDGSEKIASQPKGQLSESKTQIIDSFQKIYNMSVYVLVPFPIYEFEVF